MAHEQKQKVKKPSKWKYERMKLEGKSNEVVYLNLFFNDFEIHIFTDDGLELNSDSIQP